MIPTHLRKKRIWTVADFAEFLGEGTSHWQARELLKTYDREMAGMLLIRSKGTNREYRFYPAQLAKAFPQIFDRVDSLEMRVDEQEEAIGEIRAHQRIITAQVGQNTRDIAKMRRPRRAAA